MPKVPPPVIEQVVTTGEVPGAPNNSLPAVPGVQSLLRADPRQEYVAGGGWEWYRAYTRSLPWAIDDVTADFGDDLYERMMVHHQVSACVNVLKAGILQDGIQLSPAVVDSDDPDFALATQINDWCDEILADLSTPLDDVLWNMTDAIALGNKVAELCYVDDTVYTGRQQLILNAIKVKPRTSTAFVVDAYRNVIGLMALIPGVSFTVQIGQAIGNPVDIPNLLPREKFAILTFRQKDSDPRGTSILRSAYDTWNRATQTKPEHVRYLAQFASPSVIGYTPDNAQSLPITDSNGNVLFDSNGLAMQTTPEQVMLQTLVSWRNGTAMAFPFGSKVDVVHMVGNGEAFLRSFEMFDHEIVKAILNQSLATDETRHMARAAAQVHQDVLATIVRAGKRSVVRMLTRDVLRPLIRYNYGRQAERLCPQVSLGETEQQDIAVLLQALASAGYVIDPSQFTAVDMMLSLPTRQPVASPDVSEPLPDSAETSEPTGAEKSSGPVALQPVSTSAPMDQSAQAERVTVGVRAHTRQVARRAPVAATTEKT